MRAPTIAGWTWACLPCNATWVSGDVVHVCAHTEDYRRQFWVRRLRFAWPEATYDQVSALVDRPVARFELELLLGPGWGDDTSHEGAG